jgi:hypothetical protein
VIQIRDVLGKEEGKGNNEDENKKKRENGLTHDFKIYYTYKIFELQYHKLSDLLDGFYFHKRQRGSLEENSLEFLQQIFDGVRNDFSIDLLITSAHEH